MKRVQLTWSRNQDDNTKKYRIFRAIHKGVTRKDALIMEVDHIVVPKPIAVTENLLIRTEAQIYQSKYKNIMPESDEFPIVVTINGTNINDLGVGYGVAYEEGQFIFDVDFALGDEVIASYFIDGLRVLDTDEVTQEGVTYFGPTARDRTENSVPSNLSLLPDASTGRLELTWSDASTIGQQFSYRIEAIDEFGNFSILSEEEFIFLKEGLSNEGYVVERSFDGSNWHTVAKQIEPKYFEYGVDTEPPSPATNVLSSVNLHLGEGTADIILSWNAAGPGISSVSPRYRVRSVSAMGIVSASSSVVGPVYLTSEIKKYVIRRKVYDGAYPTFDGNDADVIGSTDGTTLTYTDKEVSDNTSFAYSIFTVDAADNHSLAATILVEVGDATSPPAV